MKSLKTSDFLHGALLVAFAAILFVPHLHAYAGDSASVKPGQQVYVDESLYTNTDEPIEGRLSIAVNQALKAFNSGAGWRVPTTTELQDLVAAGVLKPVDHFGYWSSTPSKVGLTHAVMVHPATGYHFDIEKTARARLVLVRDNM